MEEGQKAKKEQKAKKGNILKNNVLHKKGHTSFNLVSFGKKKRA